MPDGKDTRRTFIVLIPTLDGTGSLALIAQVSKVGAWLMSKGLKDQIFLGIPDRWGVSYSLWDACQKVGKAFNLGQTDSFRALLVASDEEIENAEVLADYIELADKKELNLTANVRLKGPPDNIYGGGSTVPTDTLDLAVVHPKGMGGLYYGTLFVGYPWHNDPWASEDAYFLKENPKLELRFMKRVKVSHWAKVKLPPPEFDIKDSRPLGDISA